MSQTTRGGSRWWHRQPDLDGVMALVAVSRLVLPRPIQPRARKRCLETRRQSVRTEEAAVRSLMAEQVSPNFTELTRRVTQVLGTPGDAPTRRLSIESGGAAQSGGQR